jgi:hypothetical protein
VKIEMEKETPERLRAKASRYRDMSHHVTDQRGLMALMTLADKFDAFAEQLERREVLRKTNNHDRFIH